MRTPSLLGIALLCLSAMPAAMDDGNQNSLKQCDGQHKDWYRTGQYCIRYFNTPCSFDVAESTCSQTSGAHLVSVHSSQENEDVFSLLGSASSAPRIWLGGYRDGQSNNFIWKDGSNWDYQNWVPGQPSYTSHTENCVEMNWKNQKQWNDDLCSNKKPFVCAFLRQQGQD
ncbi:ladderlectin-like [Paramormyrops kingsleyae]|uniref:ladderlectin-like n=1 Tax=Paramormyrops kingsleyae TaxID=1676925 RepID=UPI003B96C573